MEKIIDIFKSIDNKIVIFLKIMTISCFVLLSILVSIRVFNRFIPIISTNWSDEVIELLYAWLVFYGIAAIFQSNSLIRITFLLSKIKNLKKLHLYNIFLEILMFGFIVIYFIESLKLTIKANDVTSILAFPKRLSYSCMPIGGLFLIIYSIRNIVQQIISYRKT